MEQENPFSPPGRGKASSVVPPSTAPSVPADHPLLQAHNGGASWFYWIAGLSLVNAAIFAFGGQWSFIVGLGITQFVTIIGMEFARQAGGEAGMILNVIAFGITAVIAGVFILFGVLAKQRQLWAYIVGMVLYSLDGLLFVLIGDLFSIGFHVFALFCLFQGLKACQQLNQLESQAVPAEVLNPYVVDGLPDEPNSRPDPP